MSSTPPPAPRRLRSPLPAPQVRDRVLTIQNRRRTPFGLSLPQGLFGEFFSVLGALRFATRHEAAAVRARFDSDYYLDPALGPNWWAYFFSETMWLQMPRPGLAEVVCRGQHRYGPYAWNEPWSLLATPGNSRLRPFPIDSAADLRELAALATQHIRVVPRLRDQANLIRARFAPPGEFLIGLHLRATDKVINYPHRTPSFAIYLAEIARVLDHYRPAAYRIVVATDSTELAHAAQTQFGERCYLQSDSPRLAATDPKVHELGVHKHPAFGARARGESALIDCLLLSGCDYLIKNRSALSDAALVLNPELGWSFILSDTCVHRGASADGSSPALR